MKSLESNGLSEATSAPSCASSFSFRGRRLWHAGQESNEDWLDMSNQKSVEWYTEFLFEPSLPSWGGSEGYD